MYEIIVGTYENNSGFHKIIIDDNYNIISNYSSNVINNCSYLTDFKNQYIYSICEIQKTNKEFGGRIIIAKHDGQKYKIISNINSGGVNPCHISTDEQNKILAISNYTSGNVRLINIENTYMPKITKDLFFQNNSLIHCCIFHNGNLHIVDKGNNSIYTYSVNDNKVKKINEIYFNDASSPRHLIKGLNNIFYLINENDSKIITLEYKDNKQFVILDIKNIYNIKYETCGCAIKIDENKKLLYITLRETNEVKVYNIENNIPSLVQTISSFGNNPRDIDIFRNKAIVTNLESDSLSYYSINLDGSLEPLHISTQIKSPAYVKIKKC